MHKATSKGFEVITRMGDPAVLDKVDTPFTPESVWFVLFGDGASFLKIN